MALDRVLTEKIFACKTNDDFNALLAENPDLSKASRLSLDEALKAIYNKKCSGTKDKAIEMITGAAKGIDIPDVAPAMPTPAMAPPPVDMSPEERATYIQESLETFIGKAGSAYADIILKKNSNLAQLGVTPEEIKTAAEKSAKVICGQNTKVNKYFVMKRITEWIANSKKGGVDILFFGQYPDPTL